VHRIGKKITGTIGKRQYVLPGKAIGFGGYGSA
jgi:hypothetical protein